MGEYCGECRTRVHPIIIPNGEEVYFCIGCDMYRNIGSDNDDMRTLKEIMNDNPKHFCPPSGGADSV